MIEEIGLLWDKDAPLIRLNLAPPTRGEKEGVMRVYDPPLDRGIARFVDILNAHDVETYESCEGGEGHAYLEPTIRFHGVRGEGFRVLGVALNHQLPVKELRRVWTVENGEPASATWEIVFWSKGE